MVGRRHKHFRSGDLNEELGMLLLKGIAVVATVPRPEDIGIDAVATLLREGPNHLLFAENSFYMQFKSSSEGVLKYENHEVRWLESLKLPFFIGSVDKAACQIDLFAGHRLSQVLIENAYESIELVLDKTNKTQRGMDTDTESITNTLRRVNIGPPILSWTINDLSNPEFPGHAYSILKPYLEAEQRNLEFRNVRYVDLIMWESGKAPLCNQGSMLFFSLLPNEDLLHAFRSMVPSLVAIFTRCISSRDRETFEVALRLIEYMRNNGFDPDPNNIYVSMLLQWDKLASPSDIKAD